MLPKLIDNIRVTLADTLRTISKDYKHLSIATGYWDIQGTLELINQIKDYESIRLIIGQEPFNRSYLKKFGITSNISEIDDQFPDLYISSDLEKCVYERNLDQLRSTVTEIANLINNRVLEVKVFRKPVLHAKAYIFGNWTSDKAVGIVGSSNFTGAGLTKNAELNSLEDDLRIVTFKPVHDQHENGHLSWFEGFWNHPDAIDWTGEFQEILRSSPMGDLTFGPYDVYIKTLMEVYSDELDPPVKLESETADVLYSFQNRNAGILINKLNRMGLAILSDSVGLGKTITAGAVIKHYLDRASGKANIQIITPASLKQQWIDDLSSVLGVDYFDGSYKITTQQDTNALQKIYDEYNKEWRRTKNIDLFVIDEAHNLRAQKGKRHEIILRLLQQHPKSHILLLTATPINNALLDIVNLIQLASKGNTKSIPVSYVRPNGRETERMDFYDAIKRIQSQINKTKSPIEVEKILERVKPTIHEGLRNYLVRSTRQGVEAEGSIVDKSGKVKEFPKSNVESIEYTYSRDITSFVYDSIKNSKCSIFEDIDPTMLNLGLLSECTQQSSHPLDFVKRVQVDNSLVSEIFDIDENVINSNGKMFLKEPVVALIPNILQVVHLLGFTAYRPKVYKFRNYGKNIGVLRSFDTLTTEEAIQLTVHNILHVTWLKRLESSPFALLVSIKNYKIRLNLFKKYLDQGYIVSLKDAATLDIYYNEGEDIESAFEDYDNYLKQRDDLISKGRSDTELVPNGVERINADPDVYNINQLNADLERDLQILDLLETILIEVSAPKNDIKMNQLADHIFDTVTSGVYGSKVLVFSFFADTIIHLKDNLHLIMSEKIADFKDKSEFVTGNTGKIEEIVKRFSPKSKKHIIRIAEEEIDFLFATDVLSEGQNLQDSGYLINYDLHWNPVRMIQRNGRINRIGSDFKQVLIANMKPTTELEMYLNLVFRLENKIKTIRNTIGLDQSVLHSQDLNPIQFIEQYYQSGELPIEEDKYLAHTDSHIMELRMFLGQNKNNPAIVERIRNMPLGKWNYLPEKGGGILNLISLARIRGYTSETKKDFEDLFFVEVDTDDDNYIASYIDYVKALDVIKTNKEDNLRHFDKIRINRQKAISRVVTEAIRQTNNPGLMYVIQPRYLRALTIISDYLFDMGKIDIKGIIESGVNKINIQNDLEQVLRKVNKEQNEIGSISYNTITEFKEIFEKINDSQLEEKIITYSEIVLVSACKE